MKMWIAKRFVTFGQWLTALAAEWVGPERIPELVGELMQAQSDRNVRRAAGWLEGEIEERAAERATRQ